MEYRHRKGTLTGCTTVQGRCKPPETRWFQSIYEDTVVSDTLSFGLMRRNTAGYLLPERCNRW